MRVEPAERGGPKGAVGVLATSTHGSLPLRELVLLLPSSAARVSYGAPGCKPFLDGYGAARALCGTHRLLDSYPTVAIYLDPCLGPTVRAEPLPSASFLSSAM